MPPSRASINKLRHSFSIEPHDLSGIIVKKTCLQVKLWGKHIDKHRRIWFWQDRRWYKPYAWSIDLYCPTREQRCWKLSLRKRRNLSMFLIECANGYHMLNNPPLPPNLEGIIEGQREKCKKKGKEEKKEKGFRKIESRHDLETSLCLKSLGFELLKTKHRSSQIIRKLL